MAAHNPLGPIATAVCPQLDACTPNFLIQECGSMSEGYLMEPFQLQGGYVTIPDGPGLGIELDEESVREKAFPRGLGQSGIPR